jgi:ABC-type sugar transport system substrate-binding protein
MKWLYKISLAFLIAVVVTSTSMTVYYFSMVNKVYGGNNANVPGINPQYHFSLIINSGDDEYWQNFEKGVFDAAKANNAAVEYNPVTDPDINNKTVDHLSIFYIPQHRLK